MPVLIRYSFSRDDPSSSVSIDVVELSADRLSVEDRSLEDVLSVEVVEHSLSEVLEA
jgi:hypothetical protein